MATPLRLVIQVLPSTRGKDDGTDGGKASSRRRHSGNGVRLSAGASAELGSNARDQRRVDVADGPLPGASAVYMLLRRSPRARASPTPGGRLRRLCGGCSSDQRGHRHDGDRETYQAAPATEPDRVVGARGPGLSTMSPP